MNEIIKREPESSFYVATDDRGELEALRKEYRDRIISIDDPDYSRDKAAGQIFSAIDMFALSKCRIILGSSGSTFSEAASLIGKKQLEIVTNEN